MAFISAFRFHVQDLCVEEILAPTKSTNKFEGHRSNERYEDVSKASSPPYGQQGLVGFSGLYFETSQIFHLTSVIS